MKTFQVSTVINRSLLRQSDWLATTNYIL